MKHLYFFFFLACSFTQIIFAQSELTVGDDAPELKIDQWIKNGGVTSLQKGKVYLVDLWATWCVPCIAGMPHLSQLQQQYKTKGLEVIGITSEDKYGNTLDDVKKFVAKKDTLMNYNVAWVPVSIKDSEQGIWLHPWMQKSGSGNLPTAFLIDKNGKIVYIGDPFTIDKTLNAVINDNYDIDKVKADYLSGINAEKVLSQFNEAIKAKDIKNAISYGTQILSDFQYVRPNTYLVMGYQISHLDSNENEELLKLGYEAAVRGVKLTHFNSPAFFDVLAGIYAAKKDFVAAVITEKVAVSLSDGAMKKNQMKNLGKYLALSEQQEN